MVQALFDTMERLYDPEQELHFEGDADFVPMIMDGALFELINVTVFAMGIAGSMGTTNAVKYTINQITSGSGGYCDEKKCMNIFGKLVDFSSFC